MDSICNGVSEAVSALSGSPEAGANAADAILTSDTRRKVCTATVSTVSGTITVSGMAKGAGMIEPDMATMLAFICTDAAVETSHLQTLLGDCVNTTFNAITVDGDESTNDTALLFANGVSGISMNPGHSGWDAFQSAIHAVCEDLARKIVGDGEKITKVVEVRLEGAANADEANLAARAIANSLLVKSSWYGNDPNWGRLMDALGYSGAELSEDSVQLWYADGDFKEVVPAFIKGEIHEGNTGRWKEIVEQAQFGILADLGQGQASCRVWSTDLTEGYVNFNKSE